MYAKTTKPAKTLVKQFDNDTTMASLVIFIYLIILHFSFINSKLINLPHYVCVKTIVTS